MSFTDQIKNLATHDIFKEAKKQEWFVGRPYYLDFDPYDVTGWMRLPDGMDKVDDWT